MAKHEDVIELITYFKNLHPHQVVEKTQLEQRGMNFLIKFLANSGGKTFTFEIADKMHISTARVSNLVNKLEAKGLVERRISKDDARKTLISLTVEGFKQHKIMEERYYSLVSQMIDAIGKDELKQFVDTFDKMQTFLENNILHKDEE